MIHNLQGLDVVYLHLHIQLEPGVPSSGGSSFRALWVVSPRSRHRPLILDLHRLPFPTPHILQCVVLESQMLSALVSPRVPPWMETLVVHCSSALARAIPLVVVVLCPPLLPHAYPYALTTVYLAVPETLACRVFPVVVTFGLLEQEAFLSRVTCVFRSVVADL